MNTETLLPCPFCGDSEWLEIGHLYGNPNYLITVSCKTCGAVGCEKETKEEAAAAWNRRAPQPFTVIAPPLEWGEWKSRPDLGDDDSSKETLCFRYTIWRRGNLHNSAFGGKCLTWDGSKGLPDPVCTEAEAKAACQSHRQAQVNVALEGCNVIPCRDRDPQGLVDALRQISEVLKRFCQTGKLGELQQSVIDAELILKAWEDGK